MATSDTKMKCLSGEPEQKPEIAVTVLGWAMRDDLQNRPKFEKITASKLPSVEIRYWKTMAAMQNRLRLGEWSEIYRKNMALTAAERETCPGANDQRYLIIGYTSPIQDLGSKSADIHSSESRKPVGHFIPDSKYVRPFSTRLEGQDLPPAYVVTPMLHETPKHIACYALVYSASGLCIPRIIDIEVVFFRAEFRNCSEYVSGRKQSWSRKVAENCTWCPAQHPLKRPSIASGLGSDSDSDYLDFYPSLSKYSAKKKSRLLRSLPRYRLPTGSQKITEHMPIVRNSAPIRIRVPPANTVPPAIKPFESTELREIVEDRPTRPLRQVSSIATKQALLVAKLRNGAQLSVPDKLTKTITLIKTQLDQMLPPINQGIQAFHSAHFTARNATAFVAEAQAMWDDMDDLTETRVLCLHRCLKAENREQTTNIDLHAILLEGMFQIKALGPNLEEIDYGKLGAKIISTIRRLMPQKHAGRSVISPEDEQRLLIGKCEAGALLLKMQQMCEAHNEAIGKAIGEIAQLANAVTQDLAKMA